MVRDFAFAHVGGTAVVLIYHRVTDLERDPQFLAVSPANFDAQMAMLAQDYCVISLGELLTALHHRRVPDRAVVVTFDDGYADNLTNAAPILDKRGVPATVFVSSGCVQRQQEFWWDELERLILSPGRLPQHLGIHTPSGTFESDLSDMTEYSPEAARRDAGWNVLEPAANERQALYRDLTAFVAPLSAEDRESALTQLHAAAASVGAIVGTEPRPTHRPLTPAEVAALDASPVVEVGAHSVNHLRLSAQGVDEQRDEITADRDALASMCGRPMRSFSYPYGDLDSYTGETVAIVRDAGFEGACSNHLGVVKPWTDPFRLPRIIVRDSSADALAEQIEGWLSGGR
jgi:peptidoglycan/xylan/chitin deacetylase (PgdA/CDA1 family)